ncbi:MAG: hypothetical protein EXR81_06430 [Gammaproteobacteria bacterium]|nr:hypothetical protein [Gammaproteobacteria bacterium]
MPIDNSIETVQPERAFYELVHLMRYYQFVPDKERGVKLVTDSAHLSQINNYAQELTLSLLWGLQSMGRLVSTAVRNTDAGVAMDDIANIGDFVSTIANCIETTSEIAFAAQDELIHRSELK